MTIHKRLGELDLSRFYPEAQLASLPDGNYEIIEERMEIIVRGTTVTRTPTFLIRPIEAGAND